MKGYAPYRETLQAKKADLSPRMEYHCPMTSRAHQARLFQRFAPFLAAIGMLFALPLAGCGGASAEGAGAKTAKGDEAAELTAKIGKIKQAIKKKRKKKRGRKKGAAAGRVIW